MIRSKCSALLLLLASGTVLAAPAPAAAQGAAQLRIPGVASAHPDGEWIDIESFHWGSAGSRTPPATAGRGMFSFQKHYDSATPYLRRAADSGTPLPRVYVRIRGVRGAAEDGYLTITLQDVLVSSYQTGSASDLERISFTYQRIEF